MNESLWIKQTPITNFPSLDKDISIGIAIIGAGITGLTTAYYLSKTSSDICVIEADHIGYGASGRSNGKITSQHGDIYQKIVKQYGHEKAKQYYDANEEAITSLSSIIEDYHIDCGFKLIDSILYAHDEMSVGRLQDEYQACLDIGIDCEYIENSDVPFPYFGGIRFKNQAQFDPLRYLQALGNIIEDHNISIYENTVVDQIYQEGDHYRIELKNQHVIHANKVVMATQFPFIDHAHFFFARVYPMQSFILSATCDQKLNEQYINIEDEVYSYRSYQDQILIGGANQKVGQFDKSVYDKFIQQAKSLYQFNDEHIWYSQDYMSFDHIAYIGPLDKHNHNLLMATGFSKWGNTTGTIAGKLLCAYLLENESQYQSLYNPHRFKHLLSPKFVSENFNVAYEFIKGKLNGVSEEFPEPGCASVMEIDGHKYGVYQSETQEVSIVDITCPHLGCTLTFQEVDKIWACPCHGSCFKTDGTLIKGPANANLHLYGEGLNKVDPHLFKK